MDLTRISNLSGAKVRNNFKKTKFQGRKMMVFE